MQINDEEWRPVPDWEGFYEVSSLGRVRSLRRNRMLTPSVGPKGYLHVGICANNKKATKKIHQLVASAFLSEVPGTDSIDHINRIKTDNRAINLRRVHFYVNNNNVPPTSITGYVGINFVKRYKTWQARMQWMRRHYFLGSYRCAEDAIKAREVAIESLKKSGYDPAWIPPNISERIKQKILNSRKPKIIL